MSKYCMGCMERYDDELNICPYCGYVEDTPAEQALHMKPGSILHDRYIVGRALGYGGFGVTYIGWDALLEQKVAIKEYLPGEFSTRMPDVTQVTVYNGDKRQQFLTGLARFVEEAKRLAKLNEIDGVVKVYDSFQENNTAYIIMEYLEGETLAARLKREKRIAPEEAVSMLLPVIQSLQVVHDHGIIHRDIAPDNLFITKDGTVKLIDFGAARYATTAQSRSLTVIIKPGYSPEEQYRSRGDQGAYTDVYAIAATLYRMITGRTPLDAMERRAYFESKEKDILKSISAYCPDIDQNTENAILNAMNVRIEDRTQNMDALAHDLTTDEPVLRIKGKIRKIDLLRWPLWAKIAIPCVATILLVIGILFGTGVIRFSSATLQSDIVIPDGMTRVPSVISDTLDAAAERIDNAELHYSISGKEYSDAIPANMVLTQDLSAGTLVVQNTTINIVISAGVQTEISEDVMVDLTYLTENAARQLADKLGLHLSVTYEESDTVAAGLVISQDIPEGTKLQDKDVVCIVVSEGLPTFYMPDVVGETEEEAQKLLTEKGLSVTFDYEESDAAEKGKVIEQSVAADSAVTKGTEIVLTVGSGGETAQTTTGQQTTTVQQPTTVGVNSVEIWMDGSKLNLSSNVSILPGETKTLSAVIKPDNATNKSVTWKSSNTSVATVDRGRVKAVADGTATITATASNGACTSVTITVSKGELKKIAVKTLPNKESYKVGETLQTAGLTLTATYSGGSTETISSGFTCNPTTLNTAGTQAITVTFKEKTCAFSVSVEEEQQYTFKIVASPLGGNYSYSVQSDIPQFDHAYVSWGLATVKRVRNDSNGNAELSVNATSCVVSYGWDYNYVLIAVYKYNGKTYQDSYVQTEKPLRSITVQKQPTKTTYNVGETLDISGMVLVATYSNGQTVEIGADKFSWSPTVLNTAGIQTITATIYGETVSFGVIVEQKSRDIRWLNVYASKVWSRKIFEDVRLFVDFNCTPVDRSGFTIENSFGGTLAKGTPTIWADGTTMSFDIFLPDNPSIEGWQYITIKVDGQIIELAVKLEYQGSFTQYIGTEYNGSAGWAVTDWSVLP